MPRLIILISFNNHFFTLQVLKKLDISVTKEEIESICNSKPGVVEQVLIRIKEKVFEHFFSLINHFHHYLYSNHASD